MGTNSSRFDIEAHYDKKSVDQMTAEIAEFQLSIDMWPSVGFGPVPQWFNEHIEYLRMKIAGRIGTKGK